MTLSFVVLAVLIVVAWFSVLTGSAGGDGWMSAKTWVEVTGFLRQLLGLDPGWHIARPAFLQPARWFAVAGLAYQTVAMSVLAIAVAAIGALLTTMPVARTVASGELTLSRAPLWRALALVGRASHELSRSVPELVWALMIIFVFSPGLLPGALALGLHNFGILGKLYAETVENLDPAPGRALSAAGASRGQVLVFAVLPQALPQFLTYTLYRWEVIIRTTIIVGFVGAGALGLAFRLDVSFFRYTDLTLILIAYVLISMFVDLISTGLRALGR
jgi:phosphonate transport system permease protein